MTLREFSSVKVGDELPERIIPLTRQDLVNYAGVSGDLNPIHWDDETAKLVGLDTAIAHGMLTMGLGGGFVSAWVGDPAAVTEYNVRFTAVVPVPNDGKGAELVFNGRVKSLDPEDKTVTIAINATASSPSGLGRVYHGLLVSYPSVGRGMVIFRDPNGHRMVTTPVRRILKDPDNETLYVETENSVYRLNFHAAIPLPAVA